MAVRNDKIQVSIAFLTDESKDFARLIEDNKKFINDIKTAQKEGKDLSSVISDIAKRGQGISKLDLNAVAPTQLIQRAKQLQQIIHLIPQSAPEYKQLEEEYKRINDQLANMRQRSKGVAEGMGGMRSATVGFIAGLLVEKITDFVQNIQQMAVEVYKTAISLDVMSKKSKTVFGEATNIVEQFAETNAVAMGLTKSQYIEAATAAGDLLIPMGFQRNEAAQLSSQLTNLSGALSEWSGGQKSSTEVSAILTKALLGEREELKTLGIAISEDSVKAELAAQGKSKLTGKALEQAKALATLKLIMEKSVDAQTAFATGGDELVRKQAKLTAALTQIKENLAQSLIPLFTDLASAISETIIPTSKASENSKRMQFQFNAEIEALTSGNLSQSQRKQIIGEINSKYQEYLPNLLSEKSSIEDIRIAQEAANKVFDKKYAQLALEEDFVALKKEEAKVAKLSYELQKDAATSKLLQKDKGTKTDIGGVQFTVPSAEQINLDGFVTETKKKYDDAVAELKRKRDELILLGKEIGLDLNDKIIQQATTGDGNKAKVDSEKQLKAELEKIRAIYSKAEFLANKDYYEGAIDNEKDYQTTLLQLKQESLSRQIQVLKSYGKLDSAESIKLQQEKLDLIINGEKKILDIRLNEVDKASEEFKLVQLKRFAQDEINENEKNFKIKIITRQGLVEKLKIIEESGLKEVDQANKLKEELLNINADLREELKKDAKPLPSLNQTSALKLPSLQTDFKSELLILKKSLVAGLISRKDYESEVLRIQIEGIQNRLSNLRIEGKLNTDEYRQYYDELLDLQLKYNEQSKAASQEELNLKKQGLQQLYSESVAIVGEFLQYQENKIQAGADKEVEAIDKRIAALTKDEDTRRRNAATVFELEEQKRLIQEETAAKIKKLKRGEILTEGLVEVAKIWSAYATLPFIAVGLTALAAGRTALALKTVEQGFAKGGHTGPGLHEDSTGFKVAGVVHEHEYVVPKWMTTSPEYSPIISWLEDRRLKGYAQGGYVNTTPTAAALVSYSTQFSQEAIDKFNYAVERLSVVEFKTKMVYSEFESINNEVLNSKSLANY